MKTPFLSNTFLVINNQKDLNKVRLVLYVYDKTVASFMYENESYYPIYVRFNRNTFFYGAYNKTNIERNLTGLTEISIQKFLEEF